MTQKICIHLLITLFTFNSTYVVNVHCPSTGLDRGLVLIQTSEKNNVGEWYTNCWTYSGGNKFVVFCRVATTLQNTTNLFPLLYTEITHSSCSVCAFVPGPIEHLDFMCLVNNFYLSKVLDKISVKVHVEFSIIVKSKPQFLFVMRAKFSPFTITKRKIYYIDRMPIMIY